MKRLRNIFTVLVLAFLVACSSTPKTGYWEQHDQGLHDSNYTYSVVEHTTEAEQAHDIEETENDIDYGEIAETIGLGVVTVVGAVAYAAGFAFMGMACAFGGC